MTRRAPLKIGMIASLLGALATACQAADGPIGDNYGIAGYARLQGTVSHSDGSRFSSITVVYSCGDPEPTWFGSTATTDAQGAFDITVDAPGAGRLPASGSLACQIGALGRDAVIARARATTRFSQDAAVRPITTFTLVEGQSVP